MQTTGKFGRAGIDKSRTVVKAQALTGELTGLGNIDVGLGGFTSFEFINVVRPVDNIQSGSTLEDDLSQCAGVISAFGQSQSTQSDLRAFALSGNCLTACHVHVFLVTDQHQVLGVFNGNRLGIIDGGKARGILHTVIANDNIGAFAFQGAININHILETGFFIEFVYLRNIQNIVLRNT